MRYVVSVAAAGPPTAETPVSVVVDGVPATGTLTFTYTASTKGGGGGGKGRNR